MNYKKALGYGILIWVIMFVVASLFVGYGVLRTTWASVIMFILPAVLVYVFAGYLKLANVKSALSYGVFFGVVGLILDVIITRKFEPTIFSSYMYWIGYVLVVLAPVLRVKK